MPFMPLQVLCLLKELPLQKLCHSNLYNYVKINSYKEVLLAIGQFTSNIFMDIKKPKT